MLIARKLLALAIMFGMSATAAAQWGDGWGGGGYHASTYAEGVQRGYADVVRSQGAANLMNSAAAQNYEQARSMYFDNRIQGTQTYFDMRKMNRQYRQQEATPRLSSEQLFRIAAEQAPDKLSSSDLDPLTGDITWPLILELPAYEPYRQKLESLYSERVDRGGVAGPENYLDIQKTAKAALADLRTNIKDYPPDDYLKAKKFLENLAYTARFPTG